MIPLVVLVRSVLTEAQPWGSMCWPFSNLIKMLVQLH